MDKKIYLKDAEQYVSLSDEEKDLNNYIKSILWCKHNINEVNDLVLSIDREPQPCDEDFQNELYLGNLKEIIIEKIYDALHERLAEVQNTKEDLEYYANNEN